MFLRKKNFKFFLRRNIECFTVFNEERINDILAEVPAHT